MAQRIKAGSFSRLSVYSECPKRAKLAFVDKIQELPRPDPGPGKEHANERGSRVHEAAEHYVKGDRDDLIAELLNFREEFEHLKTLQAGDTNIIEAENLWTFNNVWEVCDNTAYEQIWLRILIDCFVWLGESAAVVVDYKTGKRVRNEVKHAKQGQLYMLSSFIRYPQLQEITVEFWYLDQDEMYTITYTREQGLRFLRSWNEQMITMTEDEEFKPKPNAWSCRFCPFKTGEIWKKAMGTGDCDLNP